MSGFTGVLVETDRTSTSGDDDNLDHLFCCCSPMFGLCSTDLDGEPEEDDDPERPCVVCYDLQPRPCPRCGLGPTGPCACGGCE